MPNLLIRTELAAACAVALLCLAAPAFSAGDPPKPPRPAAPDCSQYKKSSPGWKRCMGQAHQEELYERGYQMAKSGDYAGALDALRAAPVQSDPRVQTMIGFALRRLGLVDEAMAYYTAALAADPDLTNTRQYLGEAFLQKNEPDEARAQLAEIAQRRGTACADYLALSRVITAYEGRG